MPYSRASHGQEWTNAPSKTTEWQVSQASSNCLVLGNVLPLLAGPGLLPERPAWPQSHQKHLDLTKDEHQACCELFKNQPILVRPSNKTPTLMHSLGNLTRQACASGSRNHGVQNVFLLCFIFFQTPPHAGVAVCSVLGIL